MSISDINRDDDSNRAIYGEQVTANAVLSGTAPNPQPNPLKKALSS